GQAPGKSAGGGRGGARGGGFGARWGGGGVRGGGGVPRRSRLRRRFESHPGEDAQRSRRKPRRTAVDQRRKSGGERGGDSPPLSTPQPTWACGRAARRRDRASGRRNRRIDPRPLPPVV